MDHWFDWKLFWKTFVVVTVLFLLSVIGIPAWQHYRNDRRPLDEKCRTDWSDVTTDTCAAMQRGWHYSPTTRSCIYFSGPACQVLPFATGEACGQACHTTTIAPGISATGTIF